MAAGELFPTPMTIVWAYRAAGGLFAALWLVHPNPGFVLMAAAALGTAQWFRATGLLITDRAVLVSRWTGPPRTASLSSIRFVLDDAGHWSLRLRDGSDFSLPPVADRREVVAALADRLPGLVVHRVAHHGGSLRRFLRRRGR